jgi:phosphoribosylamine--glycine ligase
MEDSLVFHAGTLQKDKQIVTNGGRVMVVTAFGSNIREAAEQSVYMMEQLYFEDMKFRSDIGYEFA